MVNKKIDPRILFWVGFPILVVGFWGFFWGNQDYGGVWFIMLVVGLLFSGLGFGGMFLEPPVYQFDVQQAKLDAPAQIPDFNSKSANILLSGIGLILALIVYLYSHLQTAGFWAPTILEVVVLAGLAVIFHFKSQKYFVYADRFDLFIGFIFKKNIQIYFKDISAIQKTRNIFYMKDYRVKALALGPSLQNQAVGAISNDATGAGIMITTQDNARYVLPNCLNPDETVRQLKNLIGLN